MFSSLLSYDFKICCQRDNKKAARNERLFLISNLVIFYWLQCSQQRL